MLLRAVGMSVVVAVGIALCVSTAARVHIWGDELLIWTDAVQKSPAKPRPWNNLGTQFETRGLKSLAEAAYTKASVLAENPARVRSERVYGYALGQGNVARLQADRGDIQGAVTRLRHVNSRTAVTSVLELQKWYERQLRTP